MLLIAENNWVILWAIVTSLVGTFILAIAVEGYFLIVLPIWSRVLFFISAVTLIAPD